LTLPRELRDKILSELLIATKKIPIDLHDATWHNPYASNTHWEDHCQYHTMPDLHTSILTTCRQLHAEGTVLLYSKENKVLILPHNIQRVRGCFTDPKKQREIEKKHLIAWSVLHHWLLPPHAFDLSPILSQTNFAFLLQPQGRTLKHVTIRLYLPHDRMMSPPTPENMLGFLMQYGLDALRMLRQAGSLRMELAVESHFWFFPQLKGLTWYPNGYTHSPTQAPSNVVLNETREQYVARIEQWVRTSCRLENKSFEHIYAENVRLAKVLGLVMKQEIVINASGNNLFAAWAWDEDAFAEGVERACRVEEVV
jgi:hypothetical protein